MNVTFTTSLVPVAKWLLPAGNISATASSPDAARLVLTLSVADDAALPLLVLILSGPPLLASLRVGFLLGIFQSATQIQDTTLAFVPKLAVVMLTLLAMGPILGTQLVRFTQAIFLAIGGLR